MARNQLARHLVLLDNEAVQALVDASHPKHRRVLSYLDVVADRKRRGREVNVRVPTAVRVEAGCDRTDPRSALLNRLVIRDIALDTRHADAASELLAHTRVSVADAHLGATMALCDAEAVAVITSDVPDMRKVAGGRDVRILRL